MKMILCIFGAVCLLTSAVVAGGHDKTVAAIENLNRAAMNREWAGSAMLEYAGQEYEKAVSLTKGLFETTSVRRSAFVRAGKIYISASKSYASAVSNFDKAAHNYDKIVKLYKKIGDIENKASFQTESVKARKKGTEACRQAAIACEAAASVYNGDGDDLRGAASATQAAAGWWEKLASR